MPGEEHGHRVDGLVQVGVDVGEVVVAGGVEAHARGLGLEAQDGADVLLLHLGAQGAPFDALGGVGAAVFVGGLARRDGGRGSQAGGEGEGGEAHLGRWRQGA